MKISKALLSKIIVIFLSVHLVACAAVSVQSQLAPNRTLAKNDTLYLQASEIASIGHQKYMATLQNVLEENGFNLVPTKKQSQYTMVVTFQDFQADLVESIPVTTTTTHQGSFGGVPVRGLSVTTGSETVYRKVPTYNSTISVLDSVSGQTVWAVSMAKSYDVYNHKELKKMLEKMISLYGKEDEAIQIVADKLR